jgi:hypothetical protein
MKVNTKSSITLPIEEVRLVKRLKARLKLRTNVDVVRAGLKMLDEATARESLRAEFRRASLATREGLAAELAELDHLAGEGLD